MDELDIAVIGLACRFPDADTPQQYWANLAAGVESIRPLSEDDLRRSGVDPSEYKKSAYVRAASVLAGVDLFDAAFFGYSPKEAEILDPQVRVFLECAWEAFEDAGYDPSGFTAAVGVFAASSFNTYLLNNLRHRVDPGRFILSDGNLQQFIANAQDFVTTRVSYKLNLKGPSVNVQSACSGSLVAVHLARQSLLAGECSVALAGAVSIFLPQEVGYLHREGLILSPDGHCRPFDVQAGGTVFGRGAGAIVLKRLADAVADGDRVYAVIKGSAINNDGHAKVGYTAPSVTGQAQVIAEAMADAGVGPETITYVEAHGTATAQGDPIEMAGLTQAFRAGTEKANFCALGAVKGNIGHLDAAAGMAGLIKTILALEHKLLPPTLHFKQPNPEIDFESSPFYVNARLAEWKPTAASPRRAGVSAFGMGGTNAHVIVEEAPARAGRPAGVARPAQVLCVSGKSAEALAAGAARYAAHLGTAVEADLADVCFTANAGRAQLAHRAVVVGASREALRTGLGAVAAGGVAAGGARGEVRGSERPRVAWLFTGQGAQYAGMGRTLYATQPTFRAALEGCDAGLRGELDRPLLDVLYGAGAGAIHETVYAQPALFAVEYGLATLWRAWGVEPTAVLGHSVGEYAAACVAGVFSLADGLRLVAARGRLMQGLPRGGAMAAVVGPVATVTAQVRAQGGGVTVAAVNGPEAVVIAGPEAAVTALCGRLQAAGLASQRLAVSHAFHSAGMDPMLDAFEGVAAQVRYGPPRVRVVSNVTGQVAGADELGTAGYWRRHVREPVQFAAGMATLAAQGCDVYLEVGPHPTLVGLGRRCVPEGAGRPIVWGASLRRDGDDWPTLLETLGALWVRGVGVDWAGFDRDAPRRRVALPTYPFQRARFWIDRRREDPAAFAGSPRDEARNPVRAGSTRLLGRPLQSPALRDRVFESELSCASPAYLADHRICGTGVLPMTAYIEMALAAAGTDHGFAVLEHLELEQVMWLPESEPRTVQVIIGPPAEGLSPVQVFSSDRVQIGAGTEARWSRHASAALRTHGGGGAPPEPAALCLADIEARCSAELSGAEYYARLKTDGLEYGPDFRGIETIWCGDREALARIRRSDAVQIDAGCYRAHPALVDACAQAVYAAFPIDQFREGSLFVPVTLGRVALFGSIDDACFSHVTLRPASDQPPGRVTATIAVADRAGRVLMELSDLTLQRTSRRVFEATRRPLSKDWFYEVRWRPADWRPSPAVSDPASAVSQVRELCGLEQYDTLEPRLDRLSTEYVLAALHDLGWAPTAGQRFAATAIREILGVLPRHDRMLGRMFEMLAEDGLLDRDDAGWRVRQVPARAAPRDAGELLRQYPACRAELTMLERCGRGLAGVLRGATDPLELLFPNGSLADLEALYKSAPYTRASNTLVQRCLASALEGLPAGRTIRLLEIGAGTGGTASYVLPQLPPDRAEYVFTDVSTAFTGRARQRFAAYPFVSYRLLDIERDPATQGFAGQTFDVVLATNVLHTTADLRRTVEYARDLVEPGGLLLVVETIAPQRWVDLIFGLTDGWWRFKDPELRTKYPVISLPQWRELLEAVGFERPAFLPPEDDPAALFHQAVIVTRRPAVDSRYRAGRIEGLKPAHWLIFADAEGTGDLVRGVLTQRGDSCTVVRTAVHTSATSGPERALNPRDRDAFAQLLREVRPPAGTVGRVAYLWGLDASGETEPSLAQVVESERLVVGGALQLVQAMLGSEWWQTAPLTLVTRGAQPVAGTGVQAVAQAPLWGLGKVIAIEHPELKCHRVDLDPSRAIDVDALVAALGSESDEDEVGLRGGERYVARLARTVEPGRAASDAVSADPGAPTRLEVAAKGVLDTLVLKSSPRRTPGPGELEIQVLVAGLNFKDVLHAMGTLPGEGALGLECVGRVVRVGSGVGAFQVGDEVAAVAPGTFGTFLTTAAHYVVAKPAALTVEQAATIPVAFLTAHYALVHVAQMRAGDRVLIHAGTGGVGMAALQLAQRAGAEVFATAGSEHKREWLRARGVPHVMDSRSLEFADQIRTLTGGRGVDIVLNSLAGEFADASFSVLAVDGRFVELGKSAIRAPEDVARQRPDIRYTAIDLGQAFDAEPPLLRGMLADLMREFDAGRLTPLPMRVFASHDAIAAFRLMGQARHLGKVLVRFSGSDPPGDAVPLVRSDGTYLVTGAYGGLGILIVRWLVDRGAKSLALIGRRAPAPQVAQALDDMRRAGVSVLALTGDVSSQEDVGALLSRAASSMPPVRGVIHAAGAVEDRMLVHQDWERFARVFSGKVEGSWNLHLQTREIPLDFFVLFSTAVSLLGSAGQGNHAAANAYMDALASYRRSRGLPALSINWGPWADVGAAVTLGVTERLANQGFDAIAPQDGLDALEALLVDAARSDGARPQVGVMRMAWQTYFGQSPLLGAPRLSEVSAETERSGVCDAAARPADENIDAMVRAAAVSDREPLLLAFVRGQIAHSLGLGASDPIDLHRPLEQLGLDSLLAVEVRSVLGVALGHPLPATLLFDYPTLDRVTAYLGREILAIEPWLLPGEPGSPPGATPVAATGSVTDPWLSIEQMEDDEVDRLLADKLARGAN